MARRIGEPITVWTRRRQPIAFAWRGATYQVRVIGRWRLATRWWDVGAAADRHYFRVQASDQQVFEIYRETGGMDQEQSERAEQPGQEEQEGQKGQGERWVLDVCLD